MSTLEEIRLSYPLPIAKLYEAMRLETDPRHHVHKLMDIFEGTVHHLALIGLASYIHYGVSVPYVEKVRLGLNKPSLGHWVKLLVNLAEAIREHDPTFLVHYPDLNFGFCSGNNPNF